MCGWANAPYVFRGELCRQCQRDVAVMRRARTRRALCAARVAPSETAPTVCHNCRDGHHALERRRARREGARRDREMRARAAVDPAYRAAMNALRSLAPSLYGWEEL